MSKSYENKGKANIRKISTKKKSNKISIRITTVKAIIPYIFYLNQVQLLFSNHSGTNIHECKLYEIEKKKRIIFLNGKHTHTHTRRKPTKFENQ